MKCVDSIRTRPRRWLVAGLVVLLLAAAGFYVRAVVNVRAAASDTECRSNLKQIGLQLLGFSDFYGCLPPPFISDQAGKPLYSWRVFLLPYYGYDDAYDAFDFTKPWDDPANMRLCDGKLDVFLKHRFTCPSISQTKDIQADYFYALNAQDHWPRDFLYDANPKLLPPHVLLVESQARSVYWSEPVEFVYQEAGLNGLVGKLMKSEAPHESGFNCFLSDGAIERLPASNHQLLDFPGMRMAARTPRNDDVAAKKDEEKLILKWLEILADRQRRGWHMALLLLGELGPRAKSAVARIRELTADDDARIRSVAAFALAKIER